MQNDTTDKTLQSATNKPQSDTGVAWSLNDQIASLTAQALNGNTSRNRHLALVQLLTKLDSVEDTHKQQSLVCVARDSAIKHAGSLTDVIAALLTNTDQPERSEFDGPDVLPINAEQHGGMTRAELEALERKASDHISDVQRLSLMLRTQIADALTPLARFLNGAASTVSADDLGKLLPLVQQADSVIEAPAREQARIKRATEAVTTHYDDLRLDERAIDALWDRIDEKTDRLLNDLADAMKGGASPYDAFMKCGGDFMSLINSEIPQSKYGGVSLETWSDNLEARAKAIGDDNSGRYTDDTRDAVLFVLEGIHKPNSPGCTYERLTDFVQRAEAGEELSTDEIPDHDEDAAQSETHEAAEATDWREVKTIDDGEIAYLVDQIISLDRENAVAPLLLLIDAVQHGERGDEGDVAKRAALFNSEAGDDLAERYVKRLRFYFSREGNTNQQPSIENAVNDLAEEMDRAD